MHAAGPQSGGAAEGGVGAISARESPPLVEVIQRRGEEDVQAIWYYINIPTQARNPTLYTLTSELVATWPPRQLTTTTAWASHPST